MNIKVGCISLFVGQVMSLSTHFQSFHDGILRPTVKWSFSTNSLTVKMCHSAIWYFFRAKFANHYIFSPKFSNH